MPSRAMARNLAAKILAEMEPARQVKTPTWVSGKLYGSLKTEILHGDQAIATVWTHALTERGEIVEDPDGIARMHLMMAAPDMLVALKQASIQFRAYEQQHLAKGTPEADEKARTNARYAGLCEAAIAKAELTP